MTYAVGTPEQRHESADTRDDTRGRLLGYAHAVSRSGERTADLNGASRVAMTDPQGLFSPGPWWGFNGVLRLSVIGDTLLITPVGGWKARRRIERRVALSNVELLGRGTRAGLFGRPAVVIAKLRIDGKLSTLTSKYPDSVHVLDELPAGPVARP